MVVPKGVRATRLYRRLHSKLQRQAFRRRAVRWGLLASNLALLVIIAAVVLQNPQANSKSASAILNSTSTAAGNPLDEVSSADIAATVATMNNLPETTAVTNQAQSQAAEMVMAASSNNVISKPQVVATSLKSSADISEYAVQAGDTVSSIAAKFGITSDSLRWSNSLSGEAVSVGAKLVIPPVNGIVYTVTTGDTADNLASRFKASKDKIVAYNDAEIKGLSAGQRIIIPDGIQASAAPARPAPAATGRSAFAWGSGPVYGYNGYDYGYCTWYVANRIPSVPANWGNANTWDFYAAQSGWTVSSRPVVGAIGQSDRGAFGHVAVIEAVSADGTMVKYADMNGLAGWGREGRTPDWAPASRFRNFIYR